jgi:hypothetical protein
MFISDIDFEGGKNMTKKILGQIEVSVNDSEGTGEPIYFCKTLNEKDWDKLGLKPGDWITYEVNDEGNIVIEKVNPCDYCKNGEIELDSD